VTFRLVLRSISVPEVSTKEKAVSLTQISGVGVLRKCSAKVLIFLIGRGREIEWVTKFI
jgi:hypothetical protein